MKHSFLFIALSILLSVVFPFSSSAFKWINPMDAGYPVIQNQAFVNELSQTYNRMPERAQSVIRESVWGLSKHSAGLAIHFYTNSTELKIRYKVTGGFNMHHMPSTGVSGVDLYQVDPNGKKNFCYGKYSFKDTVVYAYKDLNTPKFNKHGYEYQMYLPLYNGVSWMEIGIDDNAELKFIPVYEEKPIVLYGTSIAQGACASRPGMAWGNIVQRSLDLPLINFGFSGSGKLDKEFIDFINEIDAQIYILDCIPNLTEKKLEETREKVVNAVKQIRAKHPSIPILLLEHAGYSNGETNFEKLNSYETANIASAQAYEILKQELVPNLYYISRKDLDFSPDGWVDYVHPSDLSMAKQANVVEKKIREILHMPVGEISTTRPVTQRREPGMYEWKGRHEQILQMNKKSPKKNVIIGNSITHYWGGVPEASVQSGKLNWEKEMSSFQNLGYGWDKIENVLWRIYHGELDGFEAENITLLIGTNNLSSNSDEEIVEGLDNLIKMIRYRQPKAKIQVMGILPRRGNEGRVKNINVEIKKMVESNLCTFTDVGPLLVLDNGKVNEKLFRDGLHPNENGYSIISPLIHK